MSLGAKAVTVFLGALMAGGSIITFVLAVRFVWIAFTAETL